MASTPTTIAAGNLAASSIPATRAIADAIYEASAAIASLTGRRLPGGARSQVTFAPGPEDTMTIIGAGPDLVVAATVSGRVSAPITIDAGFTRMALLDTAIKDAELALVEDGEAWIHGCASAAAERFPTKVEALAESARELARFTLDSAALAAALVAAQRAAATTPLGGNGELATIDLLLDIEHATITLAGTDRYRVHTATLPVQLPDRLPARPKRRRFALSLPVAQVLARLAAHGPATVTILQPATAELCIAEISMPGLRVTATLPPHHRVAVGYVVSRAETTIVDTTTVTVKDIRRAITTALSAANARAATSQLLLALRPGAVTIEARACNGTGTRKASREGWTLPVAIDASESAPSAKGSEPILLDPTYLTDALTGYSGNVTIKVGGKHSPVVLMGNPASRAVVMPQHKH